MLQAIEVIVEPGGTIRALEEIRVAAPKATLEELAEISRHCAALPVFDDRLPDEILGYAGDPLGLPG
jgi:hypothetical protein